VTFIVLSLEKLPELFDRGLLSFLILHRDKDRIVARYRTDDLLDPSSVDPYRRGGSETRKGPSYDQIRPGGLDGREPDTELTERRIRLRIGAFYLNDPEFLKIARNACLSYFEPVVSKRLNEIFLPRDLHRSDNLEDRCLAFVFLHKTQNVYA
jgi:hypothetical protein